MINNCNQLNNNKIVSVDENGKKFIIDNNSGFFINTVTVDGCFIKDGLRCDYLFEILGHQKNMKNIIEVLYVELKGKNIKHAIDQIEKTLNHCKKIHLNIKKRCFIIASKYPKASTASQEIKKKFKKTNGIQLFIDTQTKKIRL